METRSGGLRFTMEEEPETAARHRDCRHFEVSGPRAGVTEGVCRYLTDAPNGPRAHGFDVDVTAVAGQSAARCPHFEGKDGGNDEQAEG